MAMTKKEQAAFDAALKAARVLGALRWTTTPAKDVAPPTNGDVSTGWFASLPSWSTNSVELQPMWSGSVSHGYGVKTKHESGTQGSRHMHSTKYGALMQLRGDTERHAAERLAVIDAAIAVLEEPTGENP